MEGGGEVMRFFFYGTLLAGSGNAASRRIHSVLRPLGPAIARGRLYAIPDPRGWYPALLPGEGEVRGQVYEATPDFARQDLAAMDAYEDFDPAAVPRSLYRRVRIAAVGRDAKCVRAETFVFNRGLPVGSQRIAGGDFAAWLALRGRRAFEG